MIFFWLIKSQGGGVPGPLGMRLDGIQFDLVTGDSGVLQGTFLQWRIYGGGGGGFRGYKPPKIFRFILKSEGKDVESKKK